MGLGATLEVGQLDNARFCCGFDDGEHMERCR